METIREHIHGEVSMRELPQSPGRQDRQLLANFGPHLDILGTSTSN
jgi:hypothetical protein